jgi:hypothetical protein
MGDRLDRTWAHNSWIAFGVAHYGGLVGVVIRRWGNECVLKYVGDDKWSVLWYVGISRFNRILWFVIWCGFTNLVGWVIGLAHWGIVNLFAILFAFHFLLWLLRGPWSSFIFWLWVLRRSNWRSWFLYLRDRLSFQLLISLFADSICL